MSSARARVSARNRPRTRMYDSNFAIGESYYKDALDRIDRKYSGKAASPTRSSLPKEISERHAELFTDDDLPSARRRAEKVISEDNLFDIPKMRPLSTVMDTENGFDDDGFHSSFHRDTEKVVKFAMDRMNRHNHF